MSDQNFNSSLLLQTFISGFEISSQEQLKYFLHRSILIMEFSSIFICKRIVSTFCTWKFAHQDVETPLRHKRRVVPVWFILTVLFQQCLA